MEENPDQVSGFRPIVDALAAATGEVLSWERVPYTGTK